MSSRSAQHILERRSSLLAQRIRDYIDNMSTALQAANGRIPYRTPLSKNKALDWWSKHRNDALGEQALQGLSPLQVMNLDNALNEYMRQQDQGGLPQEAIDAAIAQSAPAPSLGGNDMAAGSPNAIQ